MKRAPFIAIASSLVLLVVIGWASLRHHGQELKPEAVTAAAQEDRIGPAREDSRNPITKLFHGKRLDPWSFQPIKDAEPPPTKGQWARNSVDQFVLARLEEEGLHPAPEAARRTLARRLYFDLTGLPPTYEEVETFANDRNPHAYEDLVERLLASRAFGEHWARWWLDAVRYADSNGYDWDEFRPQAWRYRDYVIRSLNADKPLDRFIREQLSGDEMITNFDMHNAEQQDCLIATGYLRAGPHDHSAEKFGEERRERAQVTADLVETTGAAFLGLTLNCARCHDHKTEPISQEDHYRMRAFFETVKYRDDLPVDLPEEHAAIERCNLPFQEELKAAEAAVEKPLDEARMRLVAKKKALGKKLTKEDEHLPDDIAIRHLNGDEREALQKATKELADVRLKLRPHELPPCMTDGEDLNRKTFILAMGDPDQPKAEVRLGFLSALDPNSVTLAKPVNPASSGRRSTLANWILAPENPLTARVLANRIWLGVFGHGIVATPNDFGYSGSRPSHPELLDWLATRLRKEHWSIKSMIRLLVNSATYRESSQSPDLEVAQEKDAENRLYWRHDLRRLTAEQLRDAVLCVAGQLRTRDGGPPVWPSLPPDVAESNPSLLKDAENDERTKNWYTSPEDQLRVRSIYLVQKRSVQVPFMETFDLPDNFTSCPVRRVSTVAPQALTMLNGPFVIEASQAFADRLEAAGALSPSKQVDLAFRLALQRTAFGREIKVARHIVEDSSLVDLARTVLNLDAFIYVD